VQMIFRGKVEKPGGIKVYMDFYGSLFKGRGGVESCAKANN
jgi:hypothetical protein